MVDIVHSGLGVDQLDQVFDDLYYVRVGEHARILRDREVQFLVEAVPSHVTEVVPLLGEEELVDDVPCSGLIRRFGIPQLLVDVVDGFRFRICRVLLEGIVDDGVFIYICFLFLKENCLDICLGEPFDGVIVQDFASLDYRGGPFHRYNLSGVLVHEVLYPCLEHFGCKFPSLIFLEVLRGGLNLVGKAEDVDDVLVPVESDGPQERGDRQFLLAVDVCVHDIVDVSGKLYPRTLERNDPGRIKLCSVGMETLSEKYSRRPVELGNDDSF